MTITGMNCGYQRCVLETSFGTSHPASKTSREKGAKLCRQNN
jgi:hypothetical protein